jgi:hypothetical protein
VIAENDDECFDLISNHYEYEFYEDCFGKLRENVIKAPRFALAEDVESQLLLNHLPPDYDTPRCTHGQDVV